MNKPRRKADYRLEMIDNELLLFHPAQARILYCNQSASLIWQLCDGQSTTQEIVALLAAAFPEAADGIADDVQATLQQLAQHGAIEFV
ncbi:MAG: PqqD family protein [Delftia sp.]|nr:PqqD family protein [Delftia sp.]